MLPMTDNRRERICLLAPLLAISVLVGSTLCFAQSGKKKDKRTTVAGVRITQEHCPIEKINATTQDNNQTRAFYRKPPGDGPFPAVVCIHGGIHSASDQSLRRLLLTNATYTRLLAAGYVTVAADFRTYEATPKARGPILDCLATVEAVKKLPSVDAESVVVFGRHRRLRQTKA